MIRVCVIRVRVVRICMIRVCMLRWLYHAQKSSEPSTENQQTPTSTSSGVTTTTATWMVMVVSHLDVLPHSAVTCLGMFQISAQLIHHKNTLALPL